MKNKYEIQIWEYERGWGARLDERKTFLTESKQGPYEVA